MLQEKGLVHVRQGSGTTVTPPAEWSMIDELVLGATIAEADGLEVLDDLVVTRRLLESDMANVAARVADDEVLQRLGQLVDRMDELVGDPGAYTGVDRVHDMIMRTSGNRIARAVVRALESQSSTRRGTWASIDVTCVSLPIWATGRSSSASPRTIPPAPRERCSSTSPRHGWFGVVDRASRSVSAADRTERIALTPNRSPSGGGDSDRPDVRTERSASG